MWFKNTSRIFLSVLLLVAAGCATAVWPPAADVPLAERERRSEDYVVVTAVATDTYKSLAKYYLGDESRAYRVSCFNNNEKITPGKILVIPLQTINPGDLLNSGGYQTIPVLSYHKLSHTRTSSKVTLSEDAFDRQMGYLKAEGYEVLTLRQFLDYMDFRLKPPKKSVLITFDDGWKTTRTIALPILKKYRFTAVLFVYTGLVKSKPNSLTLSWDDIRFLKKSGVFEIASHTVTHSDLSRISDDQLRAELQESQRIIKENTGETPNVLAYPNGIVNRTVADAARKYGYRAGFTVVRGPCAFFHNPYSLNRSMVYNSERLADFTKLLETYSR